MARLSREPGAVAPVGFEGRLLVDGGVAHFGLRASYRRTWLNRPGAEWLVDAQVGRAARCSPSCASRCASTPRCSWPPT